MVAKKEVPDARTALVSVAMLGARMHFAVPLILAQAGLLHTLYTDVYLGNKAWLKRLINLVPDGAKPNLLRQLSSRSAEGIPKHRVVSFDLLGLWYLLKRRKPLAPPDLAMLFARVNRLFGDRVVRSGLNGTDFVWGFNGASLEIFRHARSLGIKCILEQSIAPRKLELKLVAEEVVRWPDWRPNRNATCRSAFDPLAEREEVEWELADRIVCGSDFVTEGLSNENVAPEKLSIVPYGVDTGYFKINNTESGPGKLNVLFIGEIGLRKGIPYLLEALRALNKRKAIHARLVGPIALNTELLSRYYEWCEVVGAIPRGEALEMYRWADVLVLPSICEGSATVTYEAMACGLPIITTRNSGSLVRDGIEGFIVPIRDSAALQEKIALLCDDNDLRLQMAYAAKQRANLASLEAYSERLLEVLSFGSS